MQKLWILTEERPKLSVIKQILGQYEIEYESKVFYSNNFNIKPVVVENTFTFDYIVEGISIEGIEKTIIKIVSGNSSFVDYLIIRQEQAPLDHSLENVLMAIEETKTSDVESRNTGIYQRASKFVFIDHYCPEAKKYMLYSDDMTPDNDRKPTATNIFGTNMLLTLGVKFLGKTMEHFAPYKSIDEMIDQKAEMKLPNSTNVPILIKKYKDKITVSGRLAKPKDAGNIGHDPNIGALSCIGSTLRKLGWKKDIVVTHHAVQQDYIDRISGRNKCLFLFNMIDMKLEEIDMPSDITMPENYWYYTNNSEKIASIFLHLTCQYYGIHGIYENHAGCERGYFRKQSGELIALPKKDSNGINLYLPDIVLCDPSVKEIYNVEGKQLRTLNKGLSELNTFDSIENEYIKPSYPGFSMGRWLSIYGGTETVIPHEKVLVYLSRKGKVIINDNAPIGIKNAFTNIGLIV